MTDVISKTLPRSGMARHRTAAAGLTCPARPPALTGNAATVPDCDVGQPPQAALTLIAVPIPQAILSPA